MPQIELDTLLGLVGTLDDGTDPGSASTRFRKYLQENVQQIGDVRAYVNDALEQSGGQFNKALQDLTNHKCAHGLSEKARREKGKVG